MEPCSDIKRNEVLTQATTWMKAENIMMSLKKKKQNQTQKVTYCMTAFIQKYPKMGGSTETEGRFVVTRAWGVTA